LLDWSHTYVNQKGREHTRRPELFINLMTSGLQRNIDIAPDGFTTALGVPEHEWRPEYDRLRASGMNTLDVVLEMYVARLRPYYSLEPIVVKVDGVKGNIVYVMIFCTQSKEAYFLMQKEGLPAFRVWKDRKWIPRAEFVAATRREDGKAAKAGQRAMKLTDFSDEGSA
jgi:hypothetical protein